MQYRKFGKTGIEVSPLGFGVMRLPLKEGGRGTSNLKNDRIDVDAVMNRFDVDTSVKMIRESIDSGVNYIDTAYTYAGGVAEYILGRALEDGYRDKVYIATKSPMWYCNNEDDFDRILSEQLKRLKTDHIDFYMIHGLKRQSWHDKALRFGVVDKMFEAKRDGRVRYVGFSFHDNMELFREIADIAPWDFCQIQLNYLDICYQAGIEGLKYAAGKGMAVAVMEPLRGGYLAGVPDEVADILGREKSPVEWALDYLWDMPEVSVVLSGMSTPEQAKDNVEYMTRASVGMLTDEQRERFVKARERFSQYGTVPCTGCFYCSKCPKGVGIPYNFNVYNEFKTHGDLERAKAEYNNRVPLYAEKASECVGCRSCESFCPQDIKISEWMSKIDGMFRY